MSIHSAPRSEINLPSSSYEISGELLAVKPFVSTIDNQLKWAWDASYVALEPYKMRKPSASAALSLREVTRKRDYVFTIPGVLVIPLVVREDSQRLDVCHLPEFIIMQRGIDTTWVFDDDVLTRLQTLLWDKVKMPGEPLQTRIPTYGTVSAELFPYSTFALNGLGTPFNCLIRNLSTIRCFAQGVTSCREANNRCCTGRSTPTMYTL
jgi:hypothetical protein